MAKLTSEMKDILGQQLAVVATASKEGTPNVGPKGSLFVVDDETLAYSEATEGKTLRNIQQNPKVAVMVVDRDKADGYQIKGRVELISSGSLFEKVAKRQEERKRSTPKYVVKIAVEEIYSVKGAMKGKRIA